MPVVQRSGVVGTLVSARSTRPFVRAAPSAHYRLAPPMSRPLFQVARYVEWCGHGQELIPVPGEENGNGEVTLGPVGVWRLAKIVCEECAKPERQLGPIY